MERWWHILEVQGVKPRERTSTTVPLQVGPQLGSIFITWHLIRSTYLGSYWINFSRSEIQKSVLLIHPAIQVAPCYILLPRSHPYQPWQRSSFRTQYQSEVPGGQSWTLENSSLIWHWGRCSGSWHFPITLHNYSTTATELSAAASVGDSLISHVWRYQLEEMTSHIYFLAPKEELTVIVTTPPCLTF